jgi:hypothetical protein
LAGIGAADIRPIGRVTENTFGPTLWIALMEAPEPFTGLGCRGDVSEVYCFARICKRTMCFSYT